MPRLHSAALYPGSWTGQKEGNPTARPCPSSKHLWGLWTPTTPPKPLVLACSISLYWASCFGEALWGTPWSPHPQPYGVLHGGPRIPRREGLCFWLVVPAARNVCGTPTRSLHASMPPVATGARG